SPREVDKIALIAPAATINIIRNFSVAEKYKVQVPAVARGILRCANPS
ncbi:MAG: aspartate carbamoyltransferase regulatory subunit, partial [Anaerolineae bacterium]|nr:aspartate carbamoyltransferase regulatory subunit [Anaerolineae bacterium]NIN97619.1 aspartate carbamoyltransferase regulatory subunit [Anaerolineae bacterium]